jgi:hypothetical protein
VGNIFEKHSIKEKIKEQRAAETFFLLCMESWWFGIPHNVEHKLHKNLTAAVRKTENIIMLMNRFQEIIWTCMKKTLQPHPAICINFKHKKIVYDNQFIGK